MSYNIQGERVWQRAYHLIPASGAGSSGTNYNQTDYGYDVMRRRNRVQSPGGTITRSVYTLRGQVAETWAGTDDTGATDSNPAGSGAPNNMVRVTASQYDEGQECQDGNLTRVRQYTDGSSYRETNYVYDFRDRQTGTDGELDYYELRAYDNQDRVTKVERRDGSSSGTLLARSETFYDPRGRVYQQLRYAVSGGAPGNSLADKTWYDPSGNVIKRVQGGNRQFEKTQYDSLNRPVKNFRCYDLGEADTNYSAAGSVAGDTVQQQTETLYDDGGNVIQTTLRERFHNATGTGELTGGAQPKARVSYQAIYPDPIGRIQAQANYGTNGAASFTRPDTIPARSDTVLVTSTGYNEAGEAWQRTDPKGTVNRIEFDALGRQTRTIENYVSGGSNPDQNRMTEMTYAPDGPMETLTLKNTVTGDQVTTWVYGTTLSDSDVARSDLLRAKQFPGNVSGSDEVTYAYNRQGQVKAITDQRGVVRVLDYDLLGRQIHDRATTVPSGVDTAVRRITRVYDDHGFLEKLTSYDNATVGSGSIVNEVQSAYSGFGQLTREYQSHGGAVNTSSTPSVGYAYTSGSGNYLRWTQLERPDGSTVDYGYGSSGSAEDAINRVKSLVQSGVTLADYSYLGQGTPVIIGYTGQPGVELSYYTSDVSGGEYTGLDRFGRIIDQRWRRTATDADVERVKYGYNQASNRIWRQNTVGTGQDEFYTYDGLYQVKNLDRGTLNTGETGINGTPGWAEVWNYDPIGNWHGSATAYETKVSGTTTLNQNRTHDVANQITDITESTGTSWPTPAHDAAGNMSSIPRPLSLGNGYDLKWDAWNRLMEVKAGGSVVASYQYDGAFRRATKTISGTTRHYYYSDQWQVLEERVGGASSADRSYVWGIRSIDDLVLRDRMTGGGGSWSGSSMSASESGSSSPGVERLYALADAMSVRAVVDAGGLVLERYGYDGFGVPSYMDASFASRSASAYEWETLFDAYRYDLETGLYQVRYRYLHPNLGRWVSRDPIGEAGGLKLYGFVGNDPVDWVDPLGLSIQPPATPPVGIPVEGDPNARWVMGPKTGARVKWVPDRPVPGYPNQTLSWSPDEYWKRVSPSGSGESRYSHRAIPLSREQAHNNQAQRLPKSGPGSRCIAVGTGVVASTVAGAAAGLDSVVSSGAYADMYQAAQRGELNGDVVFDASIDAAVDTGSAGAFYGINSGWEGASFWQKIKNFFGSGKK